MPFLQVAMQLQDKALHKQLLQLQASIVGLKSDLSMEREQSVYLDNCGETDHDATRVPREEHARMNDVTRENRAIITKVEVLLDHNEPKPTKLQINHVQQDSGILTDDEDDHNDGDESVRKFTDSTRNAAKNFVRMQNGRSNSFHARGREVGKANFQKSWSSRSLQPAKVVVRTGEVPKNRRENAEGTSNHSAPRQRSQTMPSTPFYRVASMPVINEMPTLEKSGKPQNDKDKNGKDRDRTFGFDGLSTSEHHYGGAGGITEALKDQQSNNSPTYVSQRQPGAFYSLQRHDSMPTLSSNAGPRTYRTMSDSVRVVRASSENVEKSRNLTRGVSTSYIDLRRTAMIDAGKIKEDVSRHQTDSHGSSRRISTSYVDLRRASKSPENDDCNGFANTLSRVSTSHVDMRARSSLREAARADHKLVRRISTSYVDLRSPSPAVEGTGRVVVDLNSNEAKPGHHHKLYRSHSQTSLVWCLVNPFTPELKKYILLTFLKRNVWVRQWEFMVVYSSLLRKLWKAKFFIRCVMWYVIFLVRLQGKSEIDHSWEWKG